jgi:estrone sulfotransferase
VKLLAYGIRPDIPMLFSRISRTDTYIVAFPRSGSNWLRSMVSTLMHGAEVTPDLVDSTVPDVHRTGATRPAHLDPLIAKTHAPYLDIPAKVVYLVRDGRDATLSLHYYWVTRGRLEADAKPQELFFSNGVWPCPWHEYVTGWLDGLERRQRNVAPPHLLLRYEDLVAHPARHLESVARLAGLTGLNDTRIEQAVHLNTLQRLKTVENRAGFGTMGHVGTPRPHWREVLSPADLARYEALAGPALTRLGYLLETRQRHSSHRPGQDGNHYHDAERGGNDASVT